MNSYADPYEYDEAAQTAAPKTNIRLYLRASNLPKSIINQQPDTLARISRWPPQTHNGGTDSHHVPPNLPPTPTDIIESVGGDTTSHFDIDATTAGVIGSHNEHNAVDGEYHQILDETEIVHKSSNPRYTTSFTAEYEYGSQLLFFVDLFAVSSSSGSGTNGHKKSSSIVSASMGKFVKKKEMKFLGRAVFDVQDVLGSKNNIKARRLRKGGVVYAHIEQQSEFDPRTASRSFSAPNRMLNLRLRADSLKYVNSMKSKVVSSKFISKPDTYFEISRPSTGSWIVVYRSPTVKESVSPAWDEAQIDLSSFYTRERVSGVVLTPDSPLDAFRLRITVYKVKKKKCKEIGSFETTVESLVESCQTMQTMAKVTGYEDENTFETKQSTDEGEHPVDQKVFHLHPRPHLGIDRSDKSTGDISILKASVGNREESWKQSQRFLSGDDDDDDSTAGKSLCSMNDDDSSATGSMHQVLTHQPRPKFADYVRSGVLDIDFCVAIDFTSSNGDPRVPGTHHYSRDGMMNDYEEAIAALGSTIQKYSTTQEYPVWGFGAKFDSEVRHIFQCGNNAEWKGTDGILDAYRAVFDTDLIMSGPTVIEKVLKQAAGRAKKCYKRLSPGSNAQPGCKYCVLLILTDGIVKDLQSTKELIRKYRDLQLPLSVVVVGIGRADFSEFHQWNKEPSNLRGRFKFVEFREHQFDPDTLSMKALENVPQEVVSYFLHRKVLPN